MMPDGSVTSVHTREEVFNGAESSILCVNSRRIYDEITDRALSPLVTQRVEHSFANDKSTIDGATYVHLITNTHAAMNFFHIIVIIRHRWR